MSVPVFIPGRNVVTAITNAQNAVVTAAAHGYATGEIVRINVPQTYGMRLGNIQATITVINANTFSINYDTSAMVAFVVPGLAAFTPSEVLPISEEVDNIA